ncbi:MAG: hypothetical protein QOG00_3069, partial [Pyrinomonadaceae bacterium]|nr:hypothetical protein [Pyrinomonadaceae bacterium]
VDEHYGQTQLLVPLIPTKKLFEPRTRFFRKSHNDKDMNRES